MTATALQEAPAQANSPHHSETVLWVKHWTDRLFSFAITRPSTFRFRSGEFVMIGLPGEKKPILRAYSIASPSFAEELEFLSIKVADGPLTSRLQHIKEARNQLDYYPTVTREPFERQGRFTDLIASGRIFGDMGLEQPKFDPEHDRVMLCGSMAFIKDMAAICEDQGLKEGSNAEPGDYVLERAFVG